MNEDCRFLIIVGALIMYWVVIVVCGVLAVPFLWIYSKLRSDEDE